MLPPLNSAAGAHGTMAWREAGGGVALVLLHGIGSGSGSWGGQLDAFATSHRVIAWDAPGYGGSAPLRDERPRVAGYAAALDNLLDHLGVDETFVVGHSLGAIIAVAWAATTSRRVRGVVLASPARGYAAAHDEVRELKYRERVEMVERLGVEGMAAQRSGALCAPGASAHALATVRENMALVTPRGYSQAAWLLANEALAGHLMGLPRPPLAVLCGELDLTTPPDACERIARECGAPFIQLAGVAHACYIEDAVQFNAALKKAISG